MAIIHSDDSTTRLRRVRIYIILSSSHHYTLLKNVLLFSEDCLSLMVQMYAHRQKKRNSN
jgi:hypothetical protein